MPTKISGALLSDTLSRLGGWAGDEHAIHREFVLDSTDRQRLVADIDELAQTTRHAIDVRTTPDGVSVTLATAAVDGVSEVDVAVASRLNDLAAGTPSRLVPQQRQAHVNEVVTVEAAAVGSDERTWWDQHDSAEPVMGVPAMTSGVMPAPLPDTAPDEPEPGIAPAQAPEMGEPAGS